MDVVLGALPSLLPKLAELLVGEYNLQKQVKGSIRFLKSEFESMQGALKKISETPIDELDEQVKIWAKNVRELSYDIEDKIDIFMVEVLGSEPAKQQRFRMFIDKTIIHSFRGKFAVDIREIKCRVVEMANRCDRYKLDSVVAKPIEVDPRLLEQFKNATELVGIDVARDEVIQILMEGKDESKKQCNIVSIVGFGGLGKTTLANAVYEKLRAQFDCWAFVSVSQTPDMKKLFKGMLCELGKNINKEALDERQLIDLLRGFLQNKRYFIVLDDIWDISAWKSIRIALTENNLGSKIIITTRILDVAKQAGFFYEIKPLPLESSKLLFYRRIFGEDKCPEQFSEASEIILRKCEGVPLFIMAISSLLANKRRNLSEWNEVCVSLGSRLGHSFGIEKMLAILSLGYYALPHHLRTCLLYLSVYPKDHLIQKNKLIWSWIAQGFVCLEQEEVGLFELAESYFYELINRSMILPIEIEGIGLIYGCRVQDMVLDFIRCKSHEENFVSVWDKACSRSDRVRRLALQNKTEGNIFEANISPARLRSINAIGCPMYIIPPLESFVVLRVLDLECCRSMEGYSLEHLGKLGLLRYIGLRNTLTSKLPEEIGHLKYLQTLELEGSGVEELPGSMGQLTELMCLNADWKTRVPEWIGNLTSLQQLEMYPGGGDDEHSTKWFVNGLRNLTELRVLRFVIKVQDDGQMIVLLKSLANLHKIEVIHFDYYGAQLITGPVLEPDGFVLSRHLRSLELRWLELSNLPKWINPGDLPQLCHLCLMLSDVDEQNLKILGEFPDLRCLHLVTTSTERGEIISSGDNGAFPNLKFCNITKPLMFSQGAMPKLEVLEFHFNVRLLRDARPDFNFDFGLGHIPSLRKVTVQSNRLDAFPQQVEDAEVALRGAIGIHPNCPSLEFRLFGRVMRTTDEDVGTVTPKTKADNDGRSDKTSKPWRLFRLR